MADLDNLGWLFIKVGEPPLAIRSEIQNKKLLLKPTKKNTQKLAHDIDGVVGM